MNYHLFKIFLSFCLFLIPLLLLAEVAPNDPFFAEQNYLQQIKAPEAWATGAAGEGVIVAIIDTGVDIFHPDLAENIWKNSLEIPNDQIDNDENGYVDDYQGWDFILDSSDPRPKFGGEKTALGVNHGTIVAGIIGAVSDNNFGIAGVAPKAKIMALRALDSTGRGEAAVVAEAIDYAVNQGADIINISAVSEDYSQVLDEAIQNAYQSGAVLVTAAGNELTMTTNGRNLDLQPLYPVCYDGAANQVLGVGSVNAEDYKSLFSNYGKNCVDVMAPGEHFYALNVYEPTMADFKNYTVGYWSGTSLAAPLVSGAAALLKSVRPSLSNAEIYSLIKGNADNIYGKNQLWHDELGSGRLNLEKTLAAALAQRVTETEFIFSSSKGQAPWIRLYDQKGNLTKEFLAYGQNFKGGFSTALADFDADGWEEIVTSAGSGGGPHVRVFDQAGKVLRQFFAYETGFKGGVETAVADLDNDGKTEIVTVPESNKKKIVRIFNNDNSVKKEFIAFNESSTQADLLLSDINADGQKEIVVVNNFADQAKVKVFSPSGREIINFTVESAPGNAIQILAGNFYGDKRTEFAAFSRNNKISKIFFYSPGGSLELSWQFLKNYPSNSGIASVDLDNDGQQEFILSSFSNKQLQVASFNYLLESGQSFNLKNAGEFNEFFLSVRAK